jgi:excisionase family DNA binding protein
MTVAQAARYLGMSEKAVLEAIQEGRLSATKTMQGYTIARFVLDEYRDSLNKP